jgi:hypothetical protein
MSVKLEAALYKVHKCYIFTTFIDLLQNSPLKLLFLQAADVFTYVNLQDVLFVSWLPLLPKIYTHHQI